MSLMVAGNDQRVDPLPDSHPWFMWELPSKPRPGKAVSGRNVCPALAHREIVVSVEVEPSGIARAFPVDRIGGKQARWSRASLRAKVASFLRMARGS